MKRIVCELSHKLSHELFQLRTSNQNSIIATPIQTMTSWRAKRDLRWPSRLIGSAQKWIGSLTHWVSKLILKIVMETVLCRFCFVLVVNTRELPAFNPHNVRRDLWSLLIYAVLQLSSLKFHWSSSGLVEHSARREDPHMVFHKSNL